jgi:hypothetical protein
MYVNRLTPEGWVLAISTSHHMLYLCKGYMQVLEGF